MVVAGAKKDVINYYEKSRIGYRLFWYSDEDLAMHYGFWDNTTNTRHEALLNENKFLAEKAKVKKGDYVLDAGCGVGGSAIWIAKNIGAHVLGISITPSDIQDAKENAKRHGVESSVSFEILDYMDTKLPANTFDSVWAIEKQKRERNYS